ncbi:hypothetical protein [Azotobacter vinelandii]
MHKLNGSHMLSRLLNKKTLAAIVMAILFPLTGWVVAQVLNVPGVEWKTLAAIGGMSVLAIMSMAMGADSSPAAGRDEKS